MTTFRYQTNKGEQWGYHFQAGGRRYLRRGYPTKGKARTACETHREQVDLGRIGHFKRFDELASAWLTDLGYRATAQWARQCELKLNNLVPDWQAMPPEKITPHHVQSALLRVRGKAGKPPKASTYNEARKILHSAFQFAVDLGSLADNPVRRIDRRGVDYGEPRIISTEHLRALMTASAPELRQFLCLLAATGARSNEIATLKVTDVHLEDVPPYVVLSTRKNRGGGLRTRRQYLAPFAVAAMRERLATGVTEWLWPGPRRTVTHRRTWQGRLWRACVRAEIPRYGFHDIRRWAGTQAMLAGASEAQVAKFLGHTSTAVTRRYMRIEDAAQVALVDKVTGALNESGHSARSEALAPDREAAQTAALAPAAEGRRNPRQ